MNYSNPYMYGGFGGYDRPPQQTQQLIKVSGLDGAKAYALPANSSVALFHESENLMYVKTTDGAGFPTIRTFRFEEMQTAPQEAVDMSAYVTKAELEEALKEVRNGKLAVSKAK